MRVAALDLGTNSFLCLIAECEGGEIKEILSDESRVVRLGQEVHKTGKLHPDALKRARVCLKDFKKQIDQFKVDQVLAVATSAARDAKNSEDFFQIGKDLNIPFKIIAGELEAKLTFFGALSRREPKKVYAVVDVGGGSTEIIIGNEQGPGFAKSVNMGCVRLNEIIGVKSQVSKEQEKEMRKLAQEIMSKALDEAQNLSPQEIVAVAGTPTTLAALELGGFVVEKVHGFKLSNEKLENWFRKISPMSTEERAQKFKLDLGRADVLPAGIILLQTALMGLKLSEMTVSVQGVRFGLAQMLAKGEEFNSP